MSFRQLHELTEMVANEQDHETALQQLATSALELTNSRHGMIAIVNWDLGVLELRYGAGEEFKSRALDEKLNIELGNEAGIVSYVAATGSVFMSGDVHHEPRYRNLFSTTHSEIAVPVRDAHGRIRAVLNVESDQLNAYDAAAKETCLCLAGLIAVVLGRMDTNQRQEALIEIADAMGTATDEEHLINRVIHTAGDILRFQACSIFLHDEASDHYVLRGSIGYLSDNVGKVHYEKGVGFTGWVCETGQPIMSHEPMKDERWNGKYVEFPSEEIASFLAVPIVFREKSIGAIRVLRRVGENTFLDNRFTEFDLRVLQAIAEQLAIGLDNIRNVHRIIRSARMIAWGELSAKSSHMIGNRVFALKGDINELKHVLDEKEPKLDDIRDLQASLATNVTRIEEILQDFRDFVSATNLECEPGDLNALIRDTVTEVFPKRTPVELKMHLQEALPPAQFDPKKLRRAISELVENALNYTEEGFLRVETGLVEEGEQYGPEKLKPNSFAKIIVEDSGPGVEEARKPLIFRPFYSSRVKGMGLGLSIVQGIVEAHGGQIYEVGTKGKGAKFVILLPLADRP